MNKLSRHFYRHAEHRLAGGRTVRGITRLECLFLLAVERAVVRRNAEIGCALENMQMAGLLRHLRDDLNTRGTGAHDTDPHTREVDAFTGPLGRVIPLA